MTVDPALTAGELTSLAGITTVRRWLSYVPFTVVATADFASGNYPEPLYEIPVTNTSAGWSDIRAGMTVVVKDGSGNIKGQYRVRKTPTSTILYINETSIYDASYIPVSLAATIFAGGNTITVYDNYALWSVLPRIVYGAGVDATIYEDYDASAGTNNTTPNVIVNIRARGVNQAYTSGKHYSSWVDAGASTARISWTAAVLKWATSIGSTVTYAWTVPGTWTSVTGATGATLTATVPQGHHILKLTVTDSIGGVTDSVCHVWVHGSSFMPISIASIGNDTEDVTGRRITFTLNDDALADIPDGVMVNYWEQATWNGTVLTANTFTTQCPGWFLRYGLQARPGTREGTPELANPALCLQMLGGFSQYFERVASPANWQQIAPSLSTMHFVIYHMMRHRAANLLKLFNYEPYSTAADSGMMPVFRVDGGNLLEQLQKLAQSFYYSNFGCDSEGTFWMRRHPSMMTTSERASVVTRCTLDAAKVSEISLTRELRNKVRKVRGEAFWNNGTATLPTPWLSDAPSAAPGQGGSETRLESQILDGSYLDAQGTLNALSAHYWAFLNNPYSDIQVTIPRNFAAFKPAQLPFVALSIPAKHMADGKALSMNGIVKSVQRTHEGSTVTTTVTLEGETRGGLGTSVPVPVPTTGNIYVPPPPTPIYIPPPATNWGDDFDYDPDQEQTQPTGAQYGRFIGATSDGRVWRWTGDGAGGTFEDISPSSGQRTTLGTLYGIRNDPYRLKRYVVWGDGGIAYTNDGLAASPTWTVIEFASGTGFDFQPALSKRDVWYWLYESAGDLYLGRTGDFFTTTSATLIAPYTAGDVTPSFTVNPHNWREVWVAAGEIGTTTTYDFTASDGGWSAASDSGFSPTTLGVYSAGVGWIQTQNQGVAFPNNHWAYCCITKSFTAQTITKVRVSYTRAAGNSLASDVDLLARLTISDDSGQLQYSFNLDGTAVEEWIGSRNASSLTIDFEAGFRNDSVPCTATVVIDRIEVFGTGSNTLYRSTDGGVTFTQSEALNERGGLPWWNWATQTANTRNTTTANFRHVRGIDGSDNIKMVAGLTGTPVTIVSADATQYPETGLAFGFLARDLDYGWYLARTGNTYKTTNGGTSWSAATAITGGASFVVWGGFQYPADSSFWGYYGYRCLGYTLDGGTTWISLWSDYDTFRTATYTSDNETIVGVICNINPRYPVPVTGG